MKILKSITLFATLAACCGGNDLFAVQEGRDRDDRSSYFHQRGYTRLNIPKGHYPPPGECRIWYPERPAGQQPPPDKCERLRTRVSGGAWLIDHTNSNIEHVHVIAYDDRRPNTILAIGEFNIGTGIFVRIVVNR